MVKPSDFFINILDFFAVLLPGAILTAVLWGSLEPTVSDQLQPFGNTALAAAFVVLSYVIGQLAYAAGSLLDKPYDTYRDRRPGERKYYEARARHLAAKDGLPRTEQAGISLYKWTEAQLRARAPTAAADIDRAQAESKFFRTLTAVLIISAGAGFVNNSGAQFLIAAALLPVAVQRFFKLRMGATELAYRHYVVLHTPSGSGATVTERSVE